MGMFDDVKLPVGDGDKRADLRDGGDVETPNEQPLVGEDGVTVKDMVKTEDSTMFDDVTVSETKPKETQEEEPDESPVQEEEEDQEPETPKETTPSDPTNERIAKLEGMIEGMKQSQPKPEIKPFEKKPIKTLRERALEDENNGLKFENAVDQFERLEYHKQEMQKELEEQNRAEQEHARAEVQAQTDEYFQDVLGVTDQATKEAILKEASEYAKKGISMTIGSLGLIHENMKLAGKLPGQTTTTADGKQLEVKEDRIVVKKKTDTTDTKKANTRISRPNNKGAAKETKSKIDSKRWQSMDLDSLTMELGNQLDQPAG